MSNRLYMAVVLTLMVNTASGANNSHLHEWARGHLLHDEDLICARAVDNDYFFAARSGDRIKSGYRIDVTSSSGPPDAFVISWRFQDEHGNHVGLASDPEIVAQGYKVLDKRMYAEAITYRPVSLVHAKNLHVSIFLKKYDSSSTSTHQSQLPEYELVQIAQCDVTLIDSQHLDAEDDPASGAFYEQLQRTKSVEQVEALLDTVGTRTRREDFQYEDKGPVFYE